MWLCEDKLKGKTTHFRSPSAAQKRACLSALLVFPRGAAEGNIEIRGKQNELFPEGPVIK